MKKYHSILRSGSEKTGDSCVMFSRLHAAKYFAAKKIISLKDWLKIYRVSK